MDYKRDAFLMIDPVTGSTKLVEQPKERMAYFGLWTSWLSRIGRNGNR